MFTERLTNSRNRSYLLYFEYNMNFMDFQENEVTTVPPLLTRHDYRGIGSAT